MGYLQLACAVEIPNRHMGFKEITSGTSGAPDGWVPSSQFITDRATASKIVDAWQPLTADTLLLGADEMSMSGRAYSIGTKTGIGTDATRYIDSPRSYTGSLYGTEQGSGSYHYYNLMVRMHAEYTGATPPATGDFKIALMAVDTVGTSYKTLGTYSLVAADYDHGAWTSGKRWIHKYAIALAACDASGWSGAGTTPGRLFVRVIANGNATTGYLYLSLSDLQIWTLGPLEGSGGVASGLAGALDTAYSLSRPTQLQETDPAEITSYLQSRRLPGGQWRAFDPSGGIKKRMWRASFVNLTETDRQKILRCWHYNRGFASNSGTAFGKARPLSLQWNQPEEYDDAGTYQAHTVHFAAKPLLVPYFKQTGWIASTRADQRYNATLFFEEA